MSDALQHECGIAFLRLLKPLEFYKEKYGTAFYGIQKMYLLMEKQHNRGQDGAGFASIKLDMEPGERYISRVRSNDPQAIQDVFSQINDRINDEMASHPEYTDNVSLQKKNIPYIGEVFLGHVRYGTFGNNSIESVHPFLRQNNWKHKTLENLEKNIWPSLNPDEHSYLVNTCNSLHKKQLLSMSTGLIIRSTCR